MPEDTWLGRDPPALDAVVTYLDREGGSSFPQLSDLALLTGLDIEDVARAARAMDGHYLDPQMRMGPPGHWHVRAVSAQARVATGQWPAPETLS
jgi:hypothetical protein